MRKIRPGGWAWIGLASGVVAVDYALIAKRHATMSEVFGNALKHPVRRWPVTLAWTVLTFHLFGELLPGSISNVRRLDPISAAARMLTPR